MNTADTLRRRRTVDEWAIGVVAMPVEEWVGHGIEHGAVPDAEPVWFEPRGLSRFAADPMLYCFEGEVNVAFELYDRWKACGTIATGRLDPASGTIDYRGVVIASPGIHFAFPTIVDTGEYLVCVPDSSDVSGLRAFQVGASRPWTPIGLLAGLPKLSDPVFHHGGDRWWVVGTAWADGEEMVQAYHARDFFGPWSACEDPPRPACFRRRSAGPVVTCGSAVVRPTQDTFDHYGAAIHLNEITALTTAGVEERHVVRVAPSAAWPFPYGMHTVSGAGDWTAIDACRRVTSSLALPQKLSGRLRRRRS